MPRQTQEHIIQAAAELFSAQGYHQTTIDDIAERAGVAKGSVYYHYKGKSALLVSVIREGVDLVRSLFHSQVPADAHPALRLRALLETAFDVMVQYHELVSFALVGSCEGVDDKARQQIDEARREVEDDLAALLAAGMREGVIRPLPLQTSAQILFGSLVRAVKIYSECSRSETREMKDDVDHIKDTLVTIVFHGICPNESV